MTPDIWRFQRAADRTVGDDATPVLVDNGSSDGTIEVANRIRMVCGRDRVVLVHEGERGYVPARAAGVKAVAGRARGSGLRTDQVLVLPTDADTVYEPGYVEAMVAAATCASSSLSRVRSMPGLRPIRRSSGWITRTSENRRRGIG